MAIRELPDLYECRLETHRSRLMLIENALLEISESEK